MPHQVIRLPDNVSVQRPSPFGLLGAVPLISDEGAWQDGHSIFIDGLLSCEEVACAPLLDCIGRTDDPYEKKFLPVECTEDQEVCTFMLVAARCQSTLEHSTNPFDAGALLENQLECAISSALFDPDKCGLADAEQVCPDVGAMRPIDGLSALESELAGCGNFAAPVIFASPGLINYLVPYLIQEESRLLTVSGSVVVPTPAAESVTPGEAWMYAVPGLLVILGEQVEFEPIRIEDNQVQLLAERPVGIATYGCKTPVKALAKYC